MTRAWNFSAGPAALPEKVLQRAKEDMLDWNGSGASVMELSHRGKAFMALAADTEQRLRRLLAVPEGYTVLFLQGGATQHFAQIPMNLAREGASADYIVTGHWSEKAVREASPYLTARVAASSSATNYLDLPPRPSWALDPNAAYVHYTPNEGCGVGVVLRGGRGPVTSCRRWRSPA